MTEEVWANWTDIKVGQSVRFVPHGQAVPVAGVIGGIGTGLWLPGPNYRYVLIRGRLERFVVHLAWKAQVMREVSCAFCGRTAVARCSRQHEMYEPTHIRRIQIGDNICRASEDMPKPGSMGTVVEVNDNDYSLVIRISRHGKPDRIKEISRVVMVRRRNEKPCAAALCENCGQDMGDDKTLYCPDHWTIHTLSVAA